MAVVLGRAGLFFINCFWLLAVSGSTFSQVRSILAVMSIRATLQLKYGRNRLGRRQIDLFGKILDLLVDCAAFDFFDRGRRCRLAFVIRARRRLLRRTRRRLQDIRAGNEQCQQQKRDGQRRNGPTIDSNHYLSPSIQKVGNPVFQPPVAMEQTEGRRFGRCAQKRLRQFQQGPRITGRMAMAEHVVVANFLSCPGQFTVEQVHKRMGPEQNSRHALQKPDYLMPANRVAHSWTKMSANSAWERLSAGFAAGSPADELARPL